MIGKTIADLLTVVCAGLENKGPIATLSFKFLEITRFDERCTYLGMI